MSIQVNKSVCGKPHFGRFQLCHNIKINNNNNLVNSMNNVTKFKGVLIMNFISLVNISVVASASSGFSHLPCC